MSTYVNSSRRYERHKGTAPERPAEVRKAGMCVANVIRVCVCAGIKATKQVTARHHGVTVGRCVKCVVSRGAVGGSGVWAGVVGRQGVVGGCHVATRRKVAACRTATPRGHGRPSLTGTRQPAGRVVWL